MSKTSNLGEEDKREANGRKGGAERRVESNFLECGRFEE